MAALGGRLEAGLRRVAPETVILADGVERLPNTICFALAGMSAETMLMAFDLEGVALSAGSACSSGKVERSHVLAAMGVRAELANAAIRVSLGWSSTEREVELFHAAWQGIYSKFQERSRAA
jgi:cysteine desulfurase